MKKWLLILSFAMVAPQLGCADDDGETNSSMNDDPETTTVIRGRLTAEAAGEAGAEGQIVSARRVTEDGQTGMVEAETTTTSDGQYTLTLGDGLQPADTVVVDAYDGNEQIGRVLLMGGLATDGELDAPPITLQSTAETNVRITSRAEGFSCDACTAANLEQRIDSSLAVVLGTLSEGEGSVYVDFTESLFAGIDAHTEMLRNDATDATETELEEAMDSADEEYLVLQADLAAATSDAEVQDAQDRYAEAYLRGFFDAGITRQDLAIASHAETIARNATEVTSSADGSASLLADIELQRSTRVTAAIEATFEAYGDSTQTVEQAGNELQVAIGQAANSGADAQGEIDAAWSAYAEVVESELDAQLDTTQAGVFDGFDDAFDVGVEAFSDAVRMLDPLADVTIRVGGAVAAVATLHEQVVSEDNIDSLVEAGLAADTARAYLGVMFHLRAVSTLDA